MRINIYDHDVEVMAERAELVTKIDAAGSEFHGIRFYTEPPRMHQPGDDDSAAITLWVPWNHGGGRDMSALRKIAAVILKYCDQVKSL
jgi:hypothetical protein